MGAGVPLVAAPSATHPTPYATKTNPIQFIDDIYALLTGPRLYSRISTDPGTSHRNYSSMAVIKDSKRPGRREMKRTKDIPAFNYIVPELPPQWMEASRTEFYPEDVSVAWKLAIRAPPYLRESHNETPHSISFSEWLLATCI